jgi:hypothetical protein
MFVYKFTVDNFHLQDPSTIIIQSNEMPTKSLSIQEKYKNLPTYVVCCNFL